MKTLSISDLKALAIAGWAYGPKLTEAVKYLGTVRMIELLEAEIERKKKSDLSACCVHEIQLKLLRESLAEMEPNG